MDKFDKAELITYIVVWFIWGVIVYDVYMGVESENFTPLYIHIGALVAVLVVLSCNMDELIEEITR